MYEIHVQKMDFIFYVWYTNTESGQPGYQMRRIYLVDSENVGDIWVPLLVSSQPDEEVLVFYTQKSPHMNYEHVRMLKETEKEAVFIKCFEGNNALDFQLVTELGYLLRENAECEYVIVTNDTGFDAVVRYWTAKNMSVSRLSGKECYRKLTGQRRRENTLPAEEAQPVLPAEEAEPAGEVQPVSVAEGEMPVTAKEAETERPVNTQEATSEQSAPVAEKTEDAPPMQEEDVYDPGTDEEAGMPAHPHEEQTAGDGSAREEDAGDGTQEDGGSAEDGVREIVNTLFRCISKDHLADFHNALVMFFGEETGKELYQEIKGDPEWIMEWAKVPGSSQKEKFDVYCKMVFDHSELADSGPEDFSSFLLKSGGKRKNLNSLRAALQGQYGKDKGMKYYSLFKSHIKIMNRM